MKNKDLEDILLQNLYSPNAYTTNLIIRLLNLAKERKYPERISIVVRDKKLTITNIQNITKEPLVVNGAEIIEIAKNGIDRNIIAKIFSKAIKRLKNR